MKEDIEAIPPSAEAIARGAAADERDALGDKREVALEQWEHDVAALLAAADKRDGLAEARDAAAGKRDMSANLDAYIHGVDDESAFIARQKSSKDRGQSKDDRTASRRDRSNLSDPKETRP